MRLTTIAAVALFIVGMSLVLLSNFLFYAMVNEINACSEPEEQIDLFFAQREMAQILERYANIQPNSRRARQAYVAGISGLVIAFAGFVIFISPSLICL
jgi:hypothetical protein